MAETEREFQLRQTKQGAYVVPLDDLRSVDYQTKIFASGEMPLSSQYIFASGKIGYLKQILVTNLSGINPVVLKFADIATSLSGNPASKVVTLAYNYLASGASGVYTWNTVFSPAIGPFVSGIATVSGGAQLAGTVTAIVQLDPATYQ